MRLEFHPQVSSDISEITRYYEEIAGPQLAEEFYTELRAAFLQAAESPRSFNIRERDLRRVNLGRFPYHFFFRIVGEETVRILVVRHHSREPKLETWRR